MATNYYSLRIFVKEENYDLIEKVLGIKPQIQSKSAWWITEHIQQEGDEHFPFIKYYLSVLEGKYDALEHLGISRDDISIWELYAYDGQCNMEFLPEDMYNIGKEGISLCVSCWEAVAEDTREKKRHKLQTCAKRGIRTWMVIGIFKNFLNIGKV
ncbi:MAG: hypothetical protein LBR81_09465 [Prevotellaceae bacterium]|jgi:hypothetical protein|nr:hypothetical protein [Prevotellaceae bacterium]